MMIMMDKTLAALENCLCALAPVSIAVSGGVDSMTLAVLAGRVLGAQARMYHAYSPAVPPAATARVKDIAARENWQLYCVDAEEFSDEHYLSNPHDRCFYCKSHLYRCIAQMPGTVLSGTNCDDLDDYRPGLRAAAQFQVIHPWVECGFDKNAIRSLCAHLGYPELAQLAAAPCLSSRIETGVRIDAAALAFVDQIENEVRHALNATIVRCRIRANHITLELDPTSLTTLPPALRAQWQAYIEQQAHAQGLPTQVTWEHYRMGSAFLQPAELSL
jgi:pyridinium-3,5-biscarboxylic acid mononucleotide sulfurtransferase